MLDHIDAKSGEISYAQVCQKAQRSGLAHKLESGSRGHKRKSFKEIKVELVLLGISEGSLVSKLLEARNVRHDMKIAALEKQISNIQKKKLIIDKTANATVTLTIQSVNPNKPSSKNTSKKKTAGKPKKKTKTSSASRTTTTSHRSSKKTGSRTRAKAK